MTPTSLVASTTPALSVPTDRPGLRVTHAKDADEHAQNLSRWDQRYDQLTPGAFEGSVTELWLPKSQVFVESANRQLRQTCAAWPESIWFGIPAAREGMMTLGGKPLTAGAVCIRDGGAEFDLMTAPDFNLFGIVVDRNAFGEYVATTTCQDLDRLLQQGDVLTLPQPHKNALCLTLGAILADAEMPGIPESRASSGALQERIFAALSGLLVAGKDGGNTTGRARHHRQQIVAKVRELLLQSPEYPPSVAELCTRLHLSRRALQNCFEEITGMGPLAYMRSLRLNEVRRQLKYSREAQPVSQVAYAWGFTHMSQFAKDYRQLFGELPSLSRRAS
jgi:AraC family ethanolamine operon transcriptional activator